MDADTSIRGRAPRGILKTRMLAAVLFRHKNQAWFCLPYVLGVTIAHEKLPVHRTLVGLVWHYFIPGQIDVEETFALPSRNA